jgi:protein-tyrosine phosphatase
MLAKRPHSNTYWVQPGRLLAGEYPGAHSGEAAITKLRCYLDAGIDYFIDLTEAGELEPYEERLYAEAMARGKEVEYRRLPIRDVSVPQSPDKMREILDTIDAALSAKRIVYVHCWGGVGRTGTVIGCHLARQGHVGDAALTRLHELFATMDKAAIRRSPETAEQEQWVRTWQEPARPT